MVSFARALIAAAAMLALAVPAAHAGRPTDPGSGVYGLPNYQVAEETPYCTADVCVHWVATTADAPADLTDSDDPGTVPDSIQHVAFGLQRAHDHMTEALGWREPVGDGTLGGGIDLSDAYVKRLDGRATGVAVRDEGADPARPHGYAIMDSAYFAPAYLGWTQRKLGPHELQHLIEYAYEGHFESWNGEATAEWAAAQSDGGYVFHTGYLRTWAETTEEPLLGVRAPNGVPPHKGYASVIWKRWLSDRYGAQIVRAIWERGAAHAPYSFYPQSVEEAFGDDRTFYDEFVTSAAAAAEWRTPSSGYAWGPAAPHVERAASLPPGGGAATVVLDHTTFALFDVPVGGATTYELRAEAPAGVAAAIALVGRRGGAQDGTLETVVQRLPEGGAGVVGLADPARFERVTAVLVNADVSLAEPAKVAPWEWNYAGDDRQLTARVVSTDRPPPPVQAAESPSVTQPDTDLPVPPPPPAIVEDLRAPALRLASLPRDALRRLRAGRSVRVTVLVGEPSALTAELVTGRGTVALRRRLVAGPAGRRVVTLRASRPARRRLARARRVTLVLAARDGAGNATTIRRPLRR